MIILHDESETIYLWPPTALNRSPWSDRHARILASSSPLTTRGTPRQRAPKGTFDRKAYQREAAKKRRAAKAQQEGK